jgi:hypothetical protein
MTTPPRASIRRSLTSAQRAANIARLLDGDHALDLVDVDQADDVDDDLGYTPPPAPEIEGAEPPDRLERFLWEREARHLPDGPPYDLVDVLRECLRSAENLLVGKRSDRALLTTWYQRCVIYEKLLRRLVMRDDRGAPLGNTLDEVRALLPRSVYQPPRGDRTTLRQPGRSGRDL